MEGGKFASIFEALKVDSKPVPFPTRPEANLDTSFRLLLPFYSQTKDTPKEVNSELASHWEERKVDSRIFSNLWPVELLLPDLEDPNAVETWASSEHYFQCAKYAPGDRLFMKTLNTRDVASYGQRRLKLNKAQIAKIAELRDSGKPYPRKKDGSDYAVNDISEPQIALEGGPSTWDEVKIGVMYDALRAKFSDAHPELKTQLLGTGTAWIIEHTKNDAQWADGATGKGLNFLGKALMFLRAELQQNQNDEQRKRWRERLTSDPLVKEFFKTPQSQFTTY